MVTQRSTGGSAAPAGPAPADRPPAGDVLLMAVAVLAVSTSGPMIAAAAAPALAIAFWRNAFGTVAVAPVALARHWAELAALSRREWRLAGGAGVLLAAHFATWVPSISFTTVASSTALVCAQPVWAALIARFTGHTVPLRAWVGIAVAVAGVLLLTGVDLAVSPRALWGDLLALVGGAFAAAYMAIGSEVRRSVGTTSYTTICYGTCALVLLAVCVVSGQPLTGYDGRTWLLLLALTVGPQLLGHSVLNRVLRTTSATVVALAILFEVPGAALIAAVWLDQIPPAAAVPALALLLLGIGLVISSRGRGTPPSVPVE